MKWREKLLNGEKLSEQEKAEARLLFDKLAALPDAGVVQESVNSTSGPGPGEILNGNHNAGQVGGWELSEDSLLSPAGTVGLQNTADPAFFAGNATPANAPFHVDHNGDMVATSATVSGDITATTGHIGGWTVDATSIKDTAATVGLSSEVTAGDDIRFFAGNTTPASAPFKVTEAGVLTATSATIEGTVTATAGAIGGWSIVTNTLRSFASAAIGIIIDAANQIIKVGNTAANHIQIDGANNRIRSSNYAAGLTGFNIDGNTGDSEFNNITVRGRLKATVFEKDVVSAVGGNLAVLNADVLDADMTAADNSTLTIKGDTTFSVGDILRIKDGIDDEWFEVTNVASAPTYTVTRDKAAVYSANANPAWAKGSAVVSYAGSGGGGIMMSSGADPEFSLFTHAGSPWTTQTENVRLSKAGVEAGGGAVTMDSTGLWSQRGTSGDEVERRVKWYEGDDLTLVLKSLQETFDGVQTNTGHLTVKSDHASDGRHILYLESGYPNFTSVVVALDTGDGDANPTLILLNSAGNDVDTHILNDRGEASLRVDAEYGTVGFGAAKLATIASGAITVVSSYMTIETEGGAASDTLTDINGGNEGDLLILRANNGAHTVIVSDMGGNVNLAGGNMSLDNVGDTLILIKSSSGNWVELSRANNA